MLKAQCSNVNAHARHAFSTGHCAFSIKSVPAKKLPPLRLVERANAGQADSRIPHPIVVDVRGHRRPDHERRMQQQTFEWPQKTLADHLIAPNDERSPRRKPEVLL